MPCCHETLIIKLFVLSLSVGGLFSYFSGLFGSRERRILILGLDGAGKTTILYRLQVGEVVTTIPSKPYAVYLHLFCLALRNRFQSHHSFVENWIKKTCGQWLIFSAGVNSWVLFTGFLQVPKVLKLSINFARPILHPDFQMLKGLEKVLHFV